MSRESGPQVIKGALAALAARAAVVFLIFFAFIMGCFVAGAGLHDPDTCWLLAIGKQVLDSGVPRADTFSYTFGFLGPGGAINYDQLLGTAGTPGFERTFVAYQWLTEVVFFLSYKLGAGYGLLSLVSVVLLLALLIGPLMVFRFLRSSPLLSMLVVVLGVVAASFHFLARPEVFSYLFLIAWIGVIIRFRRDYEEDSVVSKAIYLQPAFMLLWSNMHTGFVFGLLVTLVVAITHSLEHLLGGMRHARFVGTLWTSLSLSCLATLVNPYGFGLLAYIPELFFSPLNKYIVELEPLSMKDLTEWTYYPFVFLSLGSIIALTIRLKGWFGGERSFGWFFSIAAVVGAIVGSIISKRVIPFCSLVLICETAWLLRSWLPDWAYETKPEDNDHSGDSKDEVAKPDSAAESQSDSAETLACGSAATGFLRLTDIKLAGLLQSSTLPLLMVVFSQVGVFLISTRVIDPIVPQESHVLSVPRKALTYLAENPPQGKGFNDPQLGDMIIFYLATDVNPVFAKEPWRPAKPDAIPRVFIDTRFDMYGSSLVDDYYKIANCQKGWKSLFERYNFDWVFLKNKTHLTKRLRADDGWTVLCQDESAVVLGRIRTSDPGP